MQDKKNLRKHFLAVRFEAHSDKKNSEIASRLLSHEKIIMADTVLIYASFGSEINTWQIADHLLKKKKKLAYPKCHEKGIMTFHVIDSIEQLKDGNPGKYDICEPDEALSIPEITDRTVCITPGLAFTECGGRLGYGGGYYDRFIAANPKIYTIALAYEAIITDNLPLMPHDFMVDSIVTEERTVLCNAG